MAVISGTVALLKVAATIMKVVAKVGLKKAATLAVKKGAKSTLLGSKSLAKGVTKKGVRQFAKRKAKDFAKDKARDFLRGRKRGKKETQEIQKERGRDLIVRDRDSSAAVKFIGGESAKGGGKAAIVAPAKGSKISYGEITKKIDNIVELTGSIDAIVQFQYKQKKEEAKQLRKDRENQRKSMREALLEQKKTGKQTGSGTVGGKESGKGFNPLKFLAMVLIGTIVVGLVNAIKTLMNIMKTLGLNLHQVWVIVKYVPQVLGKVFKNALKFIKTTGGKFLKGIQSKFGKLFGGAKDKVIKGFKAIANGIKNFALGLWKTIKNAATALLKGLAKGPKMIANLVKNLPGLKAVAQGVKNVIGGVKSVGGKLISGVKNIGGKVVGKVKNVVGKGIKAVTSSKVFKTLQGGVSKVKDLAIKGFKSVKDLAIKGFKSIKGLAIKGLTKLKGIAKTLGKTLKATASKLASAAKNVVASGTKVAGNILKGTGTGGKAAGGFVGKLFPKLKGLIGKAKPLFKNLAKAAKGIKIPIIGPVIVIATSLMAQEPLDRALFKGIGTALGGMIGLALGPLGALVGELLGEAGGDLLYIAINQGPAAAAKELKSKFVKALKTGAKVFDFLTGGLRRFWGWYSLEHGWNITKLLDFKSTFSLLKKGFFSKEEPPDKKDVEKFDKKKEYKIGDRVMKGGKLRYWDGNEWTQENPLEGKQSPKEAQLGDSSLGNKVEGVDQSASYEEGADEEVVVPFPGDTGGDSSDPVVITRKTISLGSNTRSAIDTMQKEKQLATLY